MLDYSMNFYTSANMDHAFLFFLGGGVIKLVLTWNPQKWSPVLPNPVCTSSEIQTPPSSRTRANAAFKYPLEIKKKNMGEFFAILSGV